MNKYTSQHLKFSNIWYGFNESSCSEYYNYNCSIIKKLYDNG